VLPRNQQEKCPATKDRAKDLNSNVRIHEAEGFPQLLFTHRRAKTSPDHWHHGGAANRSTLDRCWASTALYSRVHHHPDPTLGEGGCMTGAATADIIRLAAEGRGDDAIARKLGITRHRVRMALARSSPLPTDAAVRELPLVLLHESPHARPVSSEHVSALANPLAGAASPVAAPQAPGLDDDLALPDILRRGTRGSTVGDGR
jgi:hypothetical protein